jgi:hypothetical protein
MLAAKAWDSAAFCFGIRHLGMSGTKDPLQILNHSTVDLGVAPQSLTSTATFERAVNTSLHAVLLDRLGSEGLTAQGVDLSREFRSDRLCVPMGRTELRPDPTPIAWFRGS